MEEENKSVQTPQYFPTIDSGYKTSLGANGQGTVFDTNGNMFHFTSPDNAYLKQLADAKWDKNVNLSADNRTMIAAGTDLFNTPFFKLDQLGSTNYETSNETITNNVLPPVEPADEEVSYSKDGNVWTFTFEEKSRGITGFNLAIQSANNNDAIHQLSNVATKLVGDDLKKSYSTGDYYRVDTTNIKLEYKSDSPVTYTITIPLKSVRLAQDSHTCIEHKGSWSTTTRTYDIAKHAAYKAIYGTTPFDYPPGLPTTWNFPKTDVDSPDASGWSYFNTIKQTFPYSFTFVQKTTGLTSNNIFEVFFCWNDVDNVKLFSQTTPNSQPTINDELGEEGFEYIEDIIEANATAYAGTSDMGKTGEITLSSEQDASITFNIQEYAKLTKTEGGSYDSISDAILASMSNTPDGQLWAKWWAHVLLFEGAGGKAEAGDSGGLTTWGCTIGLWEDKASKVFPGKYTGSRAELISLATKEGAIVIGIFAKAVVWDTAAKNNVPPIFRIIAFEGMWGGQNFMNKGLIWQDATKLYKETGGDVVAAFFVLWGWKRVCGGKPDGKLFNLPNVPSPRWGLGWTNRTGLAWFTKDPTTGTSLANATCYKLTSEGINETTYEFYLNTLKGTPFHKGEFNPYKLYGIKYKTVTKTTTDKKGKKTTKTSQVRDGRPNVLDALTDLTLGTVTLKSPKMSYALTYTCRNYNPVS